VSETPVKAASISGKQHLPQGLRWKLNLISRFRKWTPTLLAFKKDDGGLLKQQEIEKCEDRLDDIIPPKEIVYSDNSDT